MTKHDTRVKKLSTAMKRGMAICKENGIKRAIGVLFRKKKNGDITCACAMGMAYIGKYGLKAAQENYYLFKTPKVIEELPKGSKPTCFTRNRNEFYDEIDSVKDKVVKLNDNSKLPVDKIIQRLEACGL